MSRRPASGAVLGARSTGLTVDLDGCSLTIGQLAAVAAGAERVTLSDRARQQIRATRDVVERVLEAGTPVYGLTTGVAERKRVAVGPGQRAAFNRRLIANHRIAQGPAASDGLVRATICCLANSLARGYAGVRPAVADWLLAALDESRLPNVRTLGSVGEADLGPLADLADGLLAAGGLQLEAGEGLALIDCNAFSTAWAALALEDATTLLEQLEVTAALELEAFGANLDAVHEVVAVSRPQPGIELSRRRLVALLDGSYLHEPGAARNLQDPLSFRCLPQVHGATRDALEHARRVVETDCNAAQGNPLVVADEGRLVSAGNFEAVYVAAALDYARIALAPSLTAETERCVKLLQATSSGLSAGLSAAPEDADDALAELAVASQSITSEARLCAQPVSFELASTSKGEGIEDRASMAALSARRLAEMVALGRRAVAIGLVVACQALDLRLGERAAESRLGAGTRPAYLAVRRHIAFAGRGEPLPPDLEPLVDALAVGVLYAPFRGP